MVPQCKHWINIINTHKARSSEPESKPALAIKKKSWTACFKWSSVIEQEDQFKQESVREEKENCVHFKVPSEWTHPDRKENSVSSARDHAVCVWVCVYPKRALSLGSTQSSHASAAAQWLSSARIKRDETPPLLSLTHPRFKWLFFF